MTSDGGAVGLEHAVRRRAAGVHDALGDALMVEVGDLLAEVEVLQQRRAADAGLERVVGVGQPQTLRGGQKLTRTAPGRRDPPRHIVLPVGLVGLGAV